MRKLLLPIIAITILTSCDKAKSTSDSFMEDVESGKVRYLQVPNGTMFYDPEWNERLTDRLYIDLRANDWEIPTAEEIHDREELFFNLPKDIVDVELTDEHSFDDILSEVHSFSEETYKSNYSIQNVYLTYEDFRKAKLDPYSNKQTVEVDEAKKLVRYNEPVKAKSFTYKVTTTNGMELMKVHTFLLDELSDKQQWKIGAVFREDI